MAEGKPREYYLKVRLGEEEYEAIEKRAMDQGYVMRRSNKANVSAYVRDALRMKAILEDRGLTYNGAIQDEDAAQVSIS